MLEVRAIMVASDSLSVSPEKNRCVGLQPAARPVRLEFDLIRSWLQQAVEWARDTHLHEVRLSRLWVGRHGRLAFELALDLSCDGVLRTCTLQGGTLSETPSPRSKRKGRVSQHGLLGLRLVNNELGLWCCTPDRDRKLRLVRDLLDVTRAETVLGATGAAPLLGLERDGAWVRCEIAAYRAGKRCTLRAWSTDSAKTDSVFVKVFRRPPTIEQIGALRRLAAHMAERSGGRVRVPALVDFCPAMRLLVTKAVTGSTRPLGTGPAVGTITAVGTTSEDLSAAATALAIVHDTPLASSGHGLDCRLAGPGSQGLNLHTPHDEFQTVCRWVRVLQTTPSLPRGGRGSWLRLRELVLEMGCLVKAIETRAAGLSAGGYCLVHRDFFAAQLLRRGETVWLLDFDTVCLGHPEVDVSTFVAHLFLDGFLASVSSRDMIRQAEGFVERYRRCGGGIARDRLRFYLPCAMARLGAIHLARGVPAHVVEQLWELAGDCMAGSWRLC